ncbi:MAG: methyltransferase domain-containing protein [Acidobacteriaceae bacterium]|nr:methyltransferase domain-containing protein [Acidobacteriaceae bacterium]MBV8569173.1 methyltransferase domain-containing protein [Acidobacteriaceae bacterium]
MLLSKRLIEPEALERLTPEQARPNLADLVRLNRYFGGHSVIRKALHRVVDGRSDFSLLDIGCASGDSSRMIRAIYPGARVTCLDHRLVNMENAPHPKMIADAFHLPFQPCSFDVVVASLFLHHFEDGEVVQLLGEFYAVAKRALLVCDLERQLLPYIFLPLTKSLFRWDRVTVHDGTRSVRASFRVVELIHLAKNAGITAPEVRAHRPAFRLSLIARK